MDLAGIRERMEELPRALIKERMVTVKVIVMVIIMIVMVVTSDVVMYVVWLDSKEIPKQSTFIVIVRSARL